MRTPSRFGLLVGIVAAGAIGFSLHDPIGFAQTQPPSSAAAPTQAAPSSGPVRIATIDVYAIVEKMLAKGDYKKAQDDLADKWTTKLEAIKKDFAKIQADLQVLPQSDPKFQETYRTARDKQGEFDKAVQSKDVESEALTSRQLTEVYQQVRDAASKAADRMGYTHVVVTRPPERPITSQTVGATLQELLARPIIKTPAGDDITKTVAADLKVDL